MLFILILFLVIAVMIAVSTNDDTFSPAKFYLVFFALFHAGAVTGDVETAVLFLMALPLFIGLILTVSEGSAIQSAAPLPRALPQDRGESEGLRYAAVIWILSVPGVFAQLYMIAELGGLAGYINSLGSRVVDWQGYGWARTLSFFLSPLNVAYLAIGLARRRNARWWLLFALHLMLVLQIGFLSGSRSGMLNIVALLVITFHYVRRSVPMVAAGGLVAVLIASSSLLGVARQGLRLNDGQLTSGLSNTTETFNFASFNYGVDPLERIVAMPDLILAHGSTFLSLFTNFIPRTLYPEKPDTGGVFFTIEYAGNAWEGFSNLTPTFMGEWIINFGWLPGILGFVFVYTAIILFVLRLYRRVIRAPRRSSDIRYALDVALYVHLLWASVGLMIGEVTNVVLGFVLNQLAPLLVLRFIILAMEQRHAIASPPYSERFGRTGRSAKGAYR